MIEGSSASAVAVSGVDLEILDRGSGQPILFLHPWIGLAPDLPVLEALAMQGRLIAPSHPGFGRTPLPRSFSTVDDIAYLYLDLLQQLDITDCILVGVSFGAWIAAEMAIKSVERIGKIVLTSPVGVKFGDRETAGIADHFGMDRPAFAALAFADPRKDSFDTAAMSDEEIEIMARNRDATALYCWSPYMYDPKLAQRLHRITVPTLVLNGDKDRVIASDYASSLAALLPDARLETIAEAGHFPHIEQPAAFADAVARC